VRLATGYLQYDRLREAAESFRRALEADPQNPDAVLGLWQIQARLNDTSGVLALVQRAVQINPQAPNAAGILDEAARLLDQALTVRPQEPWILMNAALCQAKLRRWDRAEAYSMRAVAAVPNALTPRLMLGNLYLDQGLVDQAANQLERLAAAQPNNALVREALGRTRKVQGRLQEALTEFAAAERLRPKWVLPYLNAGDTYQRLNQFDNAVHLFTKALEVAPHSIPAALGLIQVYAASGNTERAIVLCEKTLEQYPNHPMLANNLAFLYAQKGISFDRALQIATQLVKAYPNNPTMLDTLGWVLVRASRAKEAVTQLQEAARLAPDAGIVHYHLGKALLASGQRTEAVAAFRAALACGLPPEEKKDTEASIAPL
jgi:tetratricopeptide (TPR) repeat protein